MRQILMCPYIKLTPWRRRWRRWRTPLRTSAAIPKSTYQPYGQRCRICAALLRCKRIPLSFHLHHTCVHADKRTSFETSIRRGYLHICNTSKIRSEIDDPFQCSTSTCSERSRIRSVFVSSPVQWNRLGDRIKIIQNWILTFDLIGRDRWKRTYSSDLLDDWKTIYEQNRTFDWANVVSVSSEPLIRKTCVSQLPEVENVCYSIEL